jgi:HD-GYP domain-containing protein (c-di-GMP phosphodiesterase class II)
VADELGLEERTRWHVEFGSLLHDVGKISIPSEIINKAGPLDEHERAVINTHTIRGEQMLAGIGGVLAEVGQVVRSSHERYDGRGYPDGLSGDQIPIASRILSCCDAFNVMTTNRPYRSAMPFQMALEELWTHAGTQFDPRVVEALTRVVAPDLPVGLDGTNLDAVRELLDVGLRAAPQPPPGHVESPGRDAELEGVLGGLPAGQGIRHRSGL